MKKKCIQKKIFRCFGAAALLLAVGCGTPAPPDTRTSVSPDAEHWGITITSLRLSAANTLIDLRYRVNDPQKARFLGDRQIKPYLIDEATGHKLPVPSFPKTGSLRQTAVALEPGRIYFVLFSNPGRFVQSGNRVTLVAGDFRASNLMVQ